MHASEADQLTNLTETTCFHCHKSCLDEIAHFEEKAFCCHGCKQVYQLLTDNSLEDYYVCDVNPGKAPSEQNFEFLNNPHFQDQLISFSSQGVSKVNFHLPAIHCRSCLYLLENLSKLNPGIVKTTLNFGKKDLTVWFQEDQINLGQLATLLASLGYEPLISSDEVPEEKRKRANHQTQLFIKLGIAGFCAGNAMLFSFPEYLGIEDGSLKQLFGYLNIALGSIAVFYSGSEYFKNVWAHIKLGKMTIELPILLGILVGYGRSVYEVFSHTGAGYIDSVSGLIFFLLIGKWFQQKSFDFLSFERNYKAYFPLVISKLEEGIEVNYPLNEIKIGDHLIIRNQEIIPADAVLITGSSQMDYSFVTGESELLKLNEGNSMYAGGRHTGERIEIEIKKELKQSHLTQLWEQQAFKDPLHKTENWENFANQVGGYFTVGLISLAILVGSYWHFTDPSRWSNSVVSILVIACPCALAISYPFALGHGIRWLAKSNFFIKDIQAFERMAQVDTIVLDKTGTLTLPSTQNPIAKLTRELSSSEWSALYSLALQSTHPMSRQFVRYLPKNQPIVHLEKFAEKMGKGLEAIIEGIEYRLGNAKFTGHQVPKDNDYIRSESQLYIQIGGISVGFIEFPWVYRAGIEVMIHQLQAKYKVYLLSGDKQAHAGSILDWFPDPSTYQFECSPMDKMKFIQSLQDQGKRVAMIGDGLNDAGALRQSHVGIAISDDHLHFTPASDAILKGEQLAQLPTLLAFSKFGLKLIKLSFLLSLVYNAIGLSYAVQGDLSPLIAAILMPVNSISMLLIANLGMSWKGYTLKS
ncbi:heavy metal translocating P-type ATPase [Aquirufa sp.]|jgi:Cu+-exporting ATPase|uniref:heavy metal translocating P-type ATPase n=1 Tax=Aquirufa sp. TaxID=2676249 RepID=UPI0037C0A530